MNKRILFNRTILIIVIVFTLGSEIAAQTSLGNGFYDWGSPTGLNLSFARRKTAMVVDNNNNKWIGYKVNNYGLVKFDNTTWTIYNKTNSGLIADSVTALCYDNGTMYIGTVRGVSVFNGTTWQSYHSGNSGLANDSIISIFNSNGVMWVGTTNGVYRYESSAWMPFLSGDSVRCIKANSNKVVFGTNHGVKIYSQGNWTVYDEGNSVLGNRIYNIEINNNDCWIISKNSITSKKNLHKLDLSNGTFVSLEQIVPDLFNLVDYFVADNITHDSEGNLYFFISAPVSGYGYTSPFIIAKLSGNDCSLYDFSKGYNTNTFIYSGMDASQQLWFGLGYSSTQYNIYSFKCNEARQQNKCDFIKPNNIKALVHADGGLFWDKISNTAFFVPADSITSPVFTAAAWVGGKTSQQMIKASGQRYYSRGTDFQPGPVMDSVNYFSRYDHWNHVWNVSLAEIEYHKANFNAGGYTAPWAITNWPAHGNTALGEPANIAPFVDVNNNGTYEPQYGDYPSIKGDYCMYFIYNSDCPHTETQGLKNSFEFRCMAYGYHNPADSALHNTLFMKYHLLNKSNDHYDTLYFGMFTDFDLGYAYDDYIGCDVSRNAYYCYNGTAIDGNGQPTHYGANPPAMGVVFLNQNMHSFIFFNNSGGQIGDPTEFYEYYNYMKGVWRDGVDMKYGGDGRNSITGATNVSCRYMFPGDSDPGLIGTNGVNPNYNGGTNIWDEVQMQNVPYDKRGLGSVRFTNMAPGSEMDITLAYVYARSYSGATPPSVALLKSYIDSIQYKFDNGLLVPEKSNLAGGMQQLLTVVPNPANDYVYLNLHPDIKGKQTEVKMYNNLGVLVAEYIINEDKKINVQHLQNGIYFIKARSGNRTHASKFVVQH